MEIDTKVEGDNLSSQDLQGKYTVALQQIAGETGSDYAGRQKPIYPRNARIAEQQAIGEAAKALTALWKLSKTNKR
jgi:hypothetical protein